MGVSKKMKRTISSVSKLPASIRRASSDSKVTPFSRSARTASSMSSTCQATCRTHPQRALGVAHPACLLLEKSGSDARLQVAFPIVERKQLFRAVVLEPIAAPALAVVAHLHRGEPAGAMIVQIRIELGGVEAQLVTGGDRFPMCRSTAPFPAWRNSSPGNQTILPTLSRASQTPGTSPYQEPWKDNPRSARGSPLSRRCVRLGS